MSNSRKKQAITGITCAKSEKFDKRKLNKRLRQKCNHLLKSGKDYFEPSKHEVMDVWNMQKDGKMRYAKGDKFYEKVLRK
jgi:hypothetical protein